MPSVPLAFLADHAVAHSADLKLYVLGGGIRSLSYFAFPATVPRLAVALGIEFSPDELRLEPHTIRIEASGPGPEPPVKPLSARFTVPENPLTRVTVMVKLADWPGNTFMLVGLALIWKSTTWTNTVEVV